MIIRPLIIGAISETVMVTVAITEIMRKGLNHMMAMNLKVIRVIGSRIRREMGRPQMLIGQKSIGVIINRIIWWQEISE